MWRLPAAWLAMADVEAPADAARRALLVATMDAAAPSGGSVEGREAVMLAFEIPVP
ncbi:MAG TPA: hypothetical protein VMO26_16640 [Vicinamibacterales bacterium]|nr:hypothetical protein [Vicinamibacterales bacterium]